MLTGAVSGAWFVYMVCCRDGTLYTGATNHLERRLATHNRGRGAAYTRARLPVKLVWSEPAVDRGAALRREAALKRLSRAAKLSLVHQASNDSGSN
ncbi:GIY-YIG nuclease family protein [Cystobacter fuscus]